MSPWSNKSDALKAALKNLLATPTQEFLDDWNPFDGEDEVKKEQSQRELNFLDEEPQPKGSLPPKSNKAHQKAAKDLHERVLFYKTESDRKRREDVYAHTGTVDGYLQGQHRDPQRIDAPPRSPIDDSPHQPYPHLTEGRGSRGILNFFKSRKDPVPPRSPTPPPHGDPLDSDEDHRVYSAQLQHEPASPSKLLKRHGSTSERVVDYPPQTHHRGASTDSHQKPHRTSSRRDHHDRYRDRDRDRDNERERDREYKHRDRERDRDRTDPSRRHPSHAHSYGNRGYPPSSRRDPDDYNRSRRHGSTRDREQDHSHRADDRRHGYSRRHKTSRGDDYDDEEDSEGRKKRRSGREGTHRVRRDDNKIEKPPSVHVHEGTSGREGSNHGGEAGGDFHDAASLHDSEHKNKDDPDALSVSDHLNGGLHVSG